MVLSDKLISELVKLKENTNSLLCYKNVNNIQLEVFLRNLEKERYNILNEIKLYNNTVEYDAEKIKTISDEYKATVKEDVLRIYIPEVMPTYKNLKTHAYKNILLNITQVTKPFANLFKEKVIVYIKIYDDIKNWDVDNKFIKPICDALILSGVIKDDNIDKMFYAVAGEYSDNPHTEVYVFKGKEFKEILENSVS